MCGCICGCTCPCIPICCASKLQPEPWLAGTGLA
jgi:hypothetical protein